MGVARGDEVKLENGDIIRGKVLGADDKNLTIKHVFGDEIVVPLAKVTSVETDEPTNVRLLDGSTIHGKLKPGAKPNAMAIETKSEGTIPNVEMSALQGIGPPPPDVVWSGKVALGLSITDGNTQGKNFFGGFDGERRSKQDLIEGHGYYSYAETFGEVTTRRSFARLQYNYYVCHPLYVYVGAALEYDRFRDLNLRSRGGGGLGYTWIDEKTMNFRTELGLEYVNEDFRKADDDSYTAARAALNYDWQFTDWGKFREYFEIYPSLENSKQFITHSETSLNFAFWKGFGLAMLMIWDYVSQPSDHLEKNDEQYVLTLTYTF